MITRIMNKEEVAAYIEMRAQNIPKRLTGNQGNTRLVTHMASLVQTERIPLIELLRDWLAVRIPESSRKPEDSLREAEMWVALEAVEKYHLTELKPDIEALILDIHAKKTLLPYYEDMVWKYYNALRDEKK